MKIRASALGYIMTNSRTKGELLSKTTKDYLQELLMENEFGYMDEFWSRYTEKGKQVEKESIALANSLLGWGLTFDQIENDVQKHLENDHFTGHCDVLTDTLLAEIKSSYSMKTYRQVFFSDELENKAYYYQVQAYMDLTGFDECTLVYCLVNTPYDQVEDEVRRKHWKFNLIDEDIDVRNFVQMQHNFDRVPRESRIKPFLIKRDNDVIQAMKDRVELCSEYYEQIKTEING
jgi:hypothetical protein